MHSVAYAENFHGGASFSGKWWSFVFGVRCLWCHNLKSYSCFQTNVLAKYVDIICIFLYTHSPYFMCHCTDDKLSAFQVRVSEENKLNATTQQLITAKISGCKLKQGSKTNSSLCQNNLQLKNEAVLMSCGIRAVEYKKCMAGLAGAHCRFARLNLAKLHKNCECTLRKNAFNFSWCIEVQQSLSFLCSLLRHYQMPECFYVNNCSFWALATSSSCYRNCW